MHTLTTATGLSPGEILRRADEHTLAVQSWLASRAPNGARFQGKGIRASATGIPVPLLNLALGGDFPADTPDAEIDAEIEQVKAFFAEREVAAWNWWLSPRHARVKDRLPVHGFISGRAPLPAMVAALPVPLHAPLVTMNVPDTVRVWQAECRADLEAASTIRRIAFRFPEGAAPTYFEDMADDWLRGDPARLYLAGVYGQAPAAMGALVMGAGIPGVYVMATLPDVGRRGLGSAILARILADAPTDSGMIVLTAGVQGYGLYRKFGFEEVYTYDIFTLPRE
ncbi:MAG: GNAT family N-acetyltransferase [bacterium]|nr:GNAT family N-acetyltransferase [bacterium]